MDISDRIMEIDLSEYPSTEKIVGVWKEKFENGMLDYGDLKEYWRSYVPKVLSLDQECNILEWTYDDSLARKVLFTPLEEFICYHQDPDKIFKNIKDTDSPATVCGKVFKMSEPTYNCRECCTDPTCVLCVDCFKNSEHRNHKYRMSTSSGGGCCDCGDVEAWKAHPHCSIHTVGTQNFTEFESVVIQDDMIERITIVFRAALRYAYQLLTLEHSPDLPSDLKLLGSVEDLDSFLDTPDSYCTILYNDETHTFEHVISTITKVIKCSHKDAVEFVTNIDRVGRSVVKCSTFQRCTDLKTETERITSRTSNRPLKVIVTHTHVVSHQMFAIKLLMWMQKILVHSKAFRQIFSNVLMEPYNEPLPELPIIEGILRRDCSLWKLARLTWHRLFITGMLMEYENKKLFAQIFTKNYGTIMKDYIQDDHEHSVSVASLAVQLYTVPSIAHYLIAYQDVLFILLNTFLSEGNTHIKNSRFQFSRTDQNGPFKRAQYIVFDLQYLLTTTPLEWNDELRKGFLQGMFLILRLLGTMQGMDATTRQLGQHMEYEQEWETAFNLHMKLTNVLTSVIKWAGSDKIVLVKAYRSTLKKIYDTTCANVNFFCEVQELVDHSASCILYDVGAQPISIHLPLTRLLAGLHLQLFQYGLSYDSLEFQVSGKPTPEQIIEPILRAQVMISQVQAGLWRRNGYSILHQIYFYQNVKCRCEMYDQDIALLQICATLIESNEFLIHILNKYKLIEWADFDYEENVLQKSEDDTIRQTITLVEEFLALLIVIIGERYRKGIGQVTEDDCLKKEIIQQLCTKPLSHSELTRELPDHISNLETHLDQIIREVATFKKPARYTGKGVYELKPEFYDEYNVFFYHYTKEELSRSEEAQRTRRRAQGLLDCCPPPPPPPLTDNLKMVANLLQCDVMLQIMSVTLKRALDLTARSFSEGQVQRVLHLIGYALHEEERRHCNFIRFTERSEKWEIRRCLEELYSSARVEAHANLILWTLNKFKQVQSNSTYTTKRYDIPNADEEAMEVDEQVPAITTVSVAVPEPKDLEKERLQQLAAKKRAAVMAQMMAMQQSFMKVNEKLLEEASLNETVEVNMACEDFSQTSEPIALGKTRTRITLAKEYHICILCQEKQEVRLDIEAMVYCGLIQASNALCEYRRFPRPDNPLCTCASTASFFVSSCGHVMHMGCWKKYINNVMAKENRRPYRLRQPTSYDVEKKEFLCPLCECLCNVVMPILPNLCSMNDPKHIMDEDISYDSWIQSIEIMAKYKGKSDAKKKEATILYNQKMAVNKEIAVQRLKPLATSTPTELEENSVVMIDISGDSNDGEEEAIIAHTDVAPVVIRVVDDGMLRVVGDVEDFFCNNSEDLKNFLNNVSDNIEEESQNDIFANMSSSMKEMLTQYENAYCEVNKNLTSGNDENLLLHYWKSCAYTIHAHERLLRMDSQKSLLGDLSCRQTASIESLIRICGIQLKIKPEHVIYNHALLFLKSIFEREHNSVSTILDFDPFSMLVSLTMSLTTLYSIKFYSGLPTGSILDLGIFKLMLSASVAQIMISCKFSDSVFFPPEQDMSDITHDTRCLQHLWNTICSTNQYVNTEQLWEEIKVFIRPFLRCSVLFYHFLTGIPAPEYLKEAGGDTYENMCKYLGTPVSCVGLLNYKVTLNLFSIWANHDEMRGHVIGQKDFRLDTYLPVKQLIALPEDYSDLINSVSDFSCPNSDQEESRNPTLCLICGAMLCSQSYCCQVVVNGQSVGACANHSRMCSAGAGIFLRIRECELLLFTYQNRGCFLPAPYVDEYGETDQGLRRGNPLSLCRDRYKKLTAMWVSHNIHEEVSRCIESSHGITVIQWHHL